MLRNRLPEDLLVGEDPRAVGIQTGQQRIATGTTQRERTVGAIEPHAPRRQSVDVRRLRQRIAITAQHVVEVIRNDEQHVRPLRVSRPCDATPQTQHRQREHQPLEHVCLQDEGFRNRLRLKHQGASCMVSIRRIPPRAPRFRVRTKNAFHTEAQRSQSESRTQPRSRFRAVNPQRIKRRPFSSGRLSSVLVRREKRVPRCRAGRCSGRGRHTAASRVPGRD